MSKIWTARRRLILAAVLLAALLRLWAAWQLPVDFDEPVYIQAGYDYARQLRQGDLPAVLDYPGNREHPPLTKLIYAGVVLALGGDPGFEDALLASRLVSAVLGTLAVWVLALIDPLAGLLVALQTLVVKYTGQAYLESLPLFASLAALGALLRSRSSRDSWFWLSAVALGLAGAGKYSYFPILFVLLWVYLLEKRYRWQDLLLYLGTAGLAFLAFDPALWRDPFARLSSSIAFHGAYSQGTHVQASDYPWYQPFIWVSRSAASTWHPNVFFYYSLDGLIALLALAGLPIEWRKRRWTVVWCAAGMLVLLLWPTRWPQYALVVLPALCLAAAGSLREIYRRFTAEDTYWNWLLEVLPRPSRTWVFAAVLVFGFATIGQAWNTARNTLQQRGWRRLTTENATLPGNTIYEILPGSEGEMILTGERGVAILSLSGDTGFTERSALFQAGNSPLPGDRVMAAAADPDGGIWFGGQGGISRYAEGEWQTYDLAATGLPANQGHALAVGADGRVWVGTDAGLAVFDGAAWQSWTADSSSLCDDFVMSLAVQPGASGGQIWVGTHRGLCRFDPASASWASVDPAVTGLGSGGIADLLVDRQGQVWAASLGGGLARWDGTSWTAYRTSSSDIPTNMVLKIYESQPGVFWVATGAPNQAGGQLSRFDGREWEHLTPRNSGFSGAEPLALALDPQGRLWIGTRTSGVEIYQLPAN